MWTRAGHLARLVGDGGPTSICSIDTETWPVEVDGSRTMRLEVLRLGHARYCRLDRGHPTHRDSLAFSDRAVFWAWLSARLSARRQTWLVAHNVGFDLCTIGVWDLLDRGEMILDQRRRARRDGRASDDGSASGEGVFVTDDPPTIIPLLAHGGRKIMCVDTLNWFRMPLAVLGQALGRPKLPMPDRDAPDSAWAEYCARDCEIVELAFLRLAQWVRAERLGRLSYTAPGQAMTAFRRRFCMSAITRHSVPWAKALERESYYGGDTRCFYRGRVHRRGETPLDDHGRVIDDPLLAPRGPVHLLDVTGLFPSVMRGNHYPIALIDGCEREHYTTDAPPHDPMTMIARVMIDTRDRSYPARRNGRRVYVRGRFCTALAGPELAAAVRDGAVAKWQSWAAYTLSPLFDQFVDHFWSLRLAAQRAGDMMIDLLAKILMNGLYGKFGQRSPGWRWRPDMQPLEPWTTWHVIDLAEDAVRECRAIGHQVQERIERGEHHAAFPAIAAFVTSHARERMRRLLHIAGHENTFHMAIDSLVVNDSGLRALTLAGEVRARTLGALRLEHTAEDAEFFGENHYRLGDRFCRAGVRADAVRIDERTWVQDEFESLRGQLSHAPALGVHVARRTVRLASPRDSADCRRGGWIETHYIDEPV